MDMNAFWIVAAFILVLIVALLALFGGVLVMSCLPKSLLQVGDKVDIFTDGEYNRTATITGITSGSLYIYDTLPLPLSYRGKFYGSGVDIDGVSFWYLKSKKHYILVPFAERVRKIYKQLSYPYNLCPVTSETDLLTAAQKQMEEAKKYQEESTSTETHTDTHEEGAESEVEQ